MVKAAKPKNPRGGRRVRVVDPDKKMTGQEFFDKISVLGFNYQSFGRKIGVHGRTVQGWGDGRYETGVPRYIALLVNLMIDTKSKPEDLRV